MRKLLIGICTVAAFAACSSSNNDEPSGPAGRTVLIYMAAENSMTFNRFGTKEYRDCNTDIVQMKEGAKSIGNNHLVVYVDKAKDPKKELNDSTPYLLHFWNGELRDSIPMKECLTSDPAVLESIVRQAFTDYPADSYGLVLWGHASGWRFKNGKDSIEYTSVLPARRKAYGGDTGNNSYNSSGNYWINIPSLKTALKNALNGKPRLDFIFADCCNMMCVECAYELKDVTDYLIGSPAEIPAEGAPYQTVVPAMMEKTSFYTSIVDRYYEQTTEGLHNHVPLAVVKTSEMPALAAATKTVLHTIDFNGYPNLSGLIYYLDYNLYDMNHFILRYASEAEYQSWKQAFNNAVVYKKIATEWDTNNRVFFDFDINDQTYGGLSMFVPKYTLQSSDNVEIKRMGWYYAAGLADLKWMPTPQQ